MARSRQRMKGRRESGTFAALPHDYFQSPEYSKLSRRAVAALVDLICQFRGKNNGDLCAAWKTMSKVGWTSKDQLSKAIAELLAHGWIVVTRRGEKRRTPTLFAVTWLGIDECKVKLDVNANPVPSNLWKFSNRGTVNEFPRSRRQIREKTLARHTGQSSPPHGSIRVLGFANYPATRVNKHGFGRFASPPHGALLRCTKRERALVEVE